ncbi:MAG: hypothetical protein OMM_12764, partial [Candidatus Magnetoglobus multicellularis str. Araruama]
MLLEIIQQIWKLIQHIYLKLIKINQKIFFNTAYIGNNKLLISICCDHGYFYDLNNYVNAINLLDLTTGNVMFLGVTPIKDDLSYMFTDNQGSIYLIGSDQNSTINSYQICFNNLNTSQKLISDLQFLKSNNNLYASWYCGTPYDGRWNEQDQKIYYDLNRNNWFRQIYP